MAKKLTHKEELFCRHYLVTLNQTKAALDAGYSEKTAYSIGHEKLKKPEIKKKIKELMDKRAEKVEITAQDVLRELKNYAYSDITETMLLSVEELKKLPIEIRRLITSFKHTKRKIGVETPIEEEFIELKFIDKMKSWDMINRHIGFYEKDNAQQANEIDFSKLSSQEINDYMKIVKKARSE